MLIAAAYFMANVEMPPWAGYVSGVNVVLFAIPAFWATRRWLGWRDAILLWAMLGAIAITLETFAIITGFPYGHFGYSDLLGYRLFGYAPWTVFFAWTPLIVAAWALAERLFGSGWFTVPFAAVITVVFDLVLDPGAVKLGFWRYESGGEFYGVPLSNFLGWYISGSIGAAAITIFLKNRPPLLATPIQLISSAFLIIVFWTAIAAFSLMIVPTIIGTVVVLALMGLYWELHYAFDDMVVLVDESNTAIGTAEKLPTHDANTPLHRAFSVFLFNEKGELLLQQRAATKKTWPLVWSNSCCGHVMLHEDTVDAAKRRLKFELGMRGIELHCLLPDYRYRAEKDGVVENEICPVFVGFTSREPRANAAEVESVRWLDWNEFLARCADGESELSPWSIEEARLLSEKLEFQQIFSKHTRRP